MPAPVDHAYSSPSDAPRFLGASEPWRGVLVVMPGYLAPPDTSDVGAGSTLLRLLGTAWRRLTSENYRAFVRMYRDFYANPRRPDYMVDVLKTFLAAVAPGCQITVLRANSVTLEGGDPPWADRTVACDFQDIDELARALKKACEGETRCDAVLLLHPDAIGLGQHRIEHQLRKLDSTHLLILNGRRRLYELTPELAAKLARRRFLAETRIPELILSLLASPVARFYQLLDRHVRKVA